MESWGVRLTWFDCKALYMVQVFPQKIKKNKNISIGGFNDIYDNVKGLNPGVMNVILNRTVVVDSD